MQWSKHSLKIVFLDEFLKCEKLTLFQILHLKCGSFYIELFQICSISINKHVTAL